MTATTPPVTLPTVTTTSTEYITSGAPFQVLPSNSGDVFVSVTSTGGSSVTGIDVYTPGAGSGLLFSCVDQPPASVVGAGTLVANLSYFPNGEDIAAGVGAAGGIFYHASDVLACNRSGFVVSQGAISSDQGTLDVAVTPDGRFAFFANEYGLVPGASSNGNIGVVAIQRDGSGNFTSGTTLLGQIATGGDAVAGMTLSPDGKRLYVTSEIALKSTAASGTGNPVLSRSGCVQSNPGNASINGLLTVIDVAAAEAAPGPAAILASEAAGCSPVRMAETADGSTLWVAARGDDRVLAFSTAQLETNPNGALLGYAATGGTAPVGIHLFHHDQLLAVANSNRFNTGTANATILSVASPASASVVQTIAAGLFPREITVGPDDSTLYLTNFSSDSFQVIQTSVH